MMVVALAVAEGVAVVDAAVAVALERTVSMLDTCSLWCRDRLPCFDLSYMHSPQTLCHQQQLDTVTVITSLAGCVLDATHHHM